MALSQRVRPMVVVALAAAVIGPVAEVGAAVPGEDISCRHANQRFLRKDGWIQINSPKYGDDEGPEVISAYAVAEWERGWLLVTNGKTVKASIDGGCEWTVIAGGQNVIDYQLPTDVDYGQQANPDIFTHVATPSQHAVWLISYDEAGGVPHPHAYYSENASPSTDGPTQPFESVDTGLPSVARPIAFGVGSRPEFAYLLVEEPPQSGDPTKWVRRLYGTVPDSKQPPSPIRNQWGLVPLPQNFGDVQGIAVSPAGNRTVWLWNGKKWAVSANAAPQVVDARDTDPGDPPGTPPKPPEAPPAPTWLVDAAEAPITTIDITPNNLVGLYTGTDAKSSTVRYAAGATRPGQSVRIPGLAKSAAHGERIGVSAIAGPNGTFGYDVKAGRWVDLTPAGRPELLDLELASTGATKSLFARTGTALFRYPMHKGELFIAPPPRKYIKGLDPNVIPKLPKTTIPNAKLTPDGLTVTVAPGETIDDVPIEFAVPADPLPLDVFFLVDTTTSMRTAIEGLRTGMDNIARRLASLDIDVAFGVGEFKDIEAVAPSPQNPKPEPPRVYQLRQRITKDLDAVTAGLNALNESGGGLRPEAQLIALEQAVLGKGMEPYADPGQDAKFRPAAFKVIVLVTDADFQEGGAYPRMEDTLRTLRGYGVAVVGVGVMTTNYGEAAREDLSAVALGTNTLAPPAGIDCDSDGELDVEPGEPLVCDTANSAPNVAPAIVGLLLGVRDPGTIGVDIYGDESVIDSMDGFNIGEFNLKLENRLSFKLGFTCRRDQDGRDFPLTLAGMVRAKLVETGSITVQCRGIPELPPPPIEPPPPPRKVEVPLMPPIPPPPIPPVVYQGQPPNNPPPNMNPNAGFAQQEEQQFQLAAVTQGEGEQEQEEEAIETAMSAVRSDSAAAMPVMVGAFALTALAAGAAVQQRRRTQEQTRLAYARARARR